MFRNTSELTCHHGEGGYWGIEDPNLILSLGPGEIGDIFLKKAMQMAKIDDFYKIDKNRRLSPRQ